MSTTGGSRKRRRISPDVTVTVTNTGKMETTAMKPDVPTAPIRAETEEEPNPQGQPSTCHHEQSLRALHTDVDTMRQLITCNVCQRFMYEPYALSCGHTYCYSCLAEWMGKNHKKTCPDCRNHVKQEPTPSFLIREMVLIFVNRNQLLPDGETTEEHHEMAREEAEILALDRANTDERQGGLFKGTFSRVSARPITALHDTSDHVDRCPNCLHEVEDGWCLICHVRVRASDADSDDDSIDFSDIIDEPSLSEASSGNDYNSEDDQDLSGFVDNDVRWESGADEPDYSFEAVDFHEAVRGAPILVSDVSDSEDDSDEMQPIRRRRIVNRRSAPSSTRIPVTVSSDSDEDDERDEGLTVPSNGPRARGRIIGSDSETSSGYNSEATNQHHPMAGFSPLQYDSDDTTRPVAGELSPPQFERFPIHVASSSPSDSGQESGSNIDAQIGLSVDDPTTSDDEEGASDEMGIGMDRPESDEDSEGSEQSTATGWDRHPPWCRSSND